ncbi:HAD family hydrolase [candidate division KSB1 bacterium]
MTSAAPFPEIKAVYFDLGDTIISLDRWWGEVCTAFGRVIRDHFDLPVSEKTLADRYQKAHTRTMLRLIKSDIEYQEAGIRMSALKTTLKSTGLRFDQRDIEGIFETVLSAVAAADILFPGAVDVLRVVGRRFDIALLSNGYGPWTDQFLARQGLEDVFKAVVVSSDVGCEKPDPGIFNLALEQLGRRPAETLMVGDYYDTDIRGAQAVGMRTAWINPTGENPPDGPPPDITVQRITDIPEKLGLE